MSSYKAIAIIMLVGILCLSLQACGSSSSPAEKPTTPPEPAKKELTSPTDNPGKIETTIAVPAKQTELKSDFPLPPKAKVVQTSDKMVTATISMPIKDLIEFYRADAKKKGLTEYELLTVISEKTFSMAFRVPGQEEELVLQGTDIGNNSVAFSLRYEEADVK
jgi:hypothetical protein